MHQSPRKSPQSSGVTEGPLGIWGLELLVNGLGRDSQICKLGMSLEGVSGLILEHMI